jgi:L-malate glycosyltransferase
MKVILFLHELALGGTTVNAVELATALRDQHGCEVILFAPRGPMVELVVRSRLRYVEAPAANMHPCLARMKALRSLVRHEHPDLVYVWETWALMDAYFAVHVPMRVPILLTDMQMHVTRLLPRAVPTTFGTPELVEMARAAGSRDVSLLLPPVDLRANAPGSHDSVQARVSLGVSANEVLVVVVSRLVHSMKGESLHRAIDAVATLGRDFPIRLLIVGDGSARRELENRAAAVNADLRREAISLPGALLDPRPAYSAADIVVGMGGSAMRAMAYAKPIIVVGESGFAATLTPETAPTFHHQGLFGRGNGASDAERLLNEIRGLAASPERRCSLGKFSLQFVQTHFSLDVVAGHLKVLCNAAATARPRGPELMFDCLRTAAIYLRERRFLWRAASAVKMPFADMAALPHNGSPVPEQVSVKGPI